MKTEDLSLLVAQLAEENEILRQDVDRLESDLEDKKVQVRALISAMNGLEDQLRSSKYYLQDTISSINEAIKITERNY